ncbi:hypothetical protein [Oryzobacter terrae]|uniref:hypothetical protein n=1 Tax=Oryzobacter terrae TaxID=1620385 RepID=UPI00366B6889
MNHTHDDDTPVEHDPTGMRALLAGLPDPGPMPDDLVARIAAALEAEAAAPRIHALPGATAPSAPLDASDADRPSGHAQDAPHGTVVPLRRRPRIRHLGVAAAVVGAVGLGGLALQVTQGGLTAAFDASSAGSGADSGSAVQEGAKAAGGAAAPQLPPDAGSGQVVVVLSDRAYTASDLATGARAAATETRDELRDLAAEAPTLGPIATPIGARACADALGISPTAGLLVDLARVDGRPAAVLVATDETGRRAWAVARSCPSGDPALITGPTSLD